MLNQDLAERMDDGMFLTLFMGVFGPDGSVQVVNAGHRAPLVRRASGVVEELAPDVAGVPVGIVSGYGYEMGEAALEPGDTVVLFTDGIDESRSPSGEQYGMKRLRAHLERTSGDAATQARSLLDEIHTWSAGRPPTDDIAILALTREV